MGATSTLPNRRDHERRTPTVTVELLVRDSARVLGACGISKSSSWMRRTARDYLRHAAPKGLPFGVWLTTRVQLNDEQRRRVADDPALRYVLIYADPTGEEAVRRVMRGPR